MPDLILSCWHSSQNELGLSYSDYDIRENLKVLNFADTIKSVLSFFNDCSWQGHGRLLEPSCIWVKAGYTPK